MPHRLWRAPAAGLLAVSMSTPPAALGAGETVTARRLVTYHVGRDGVIVVLAACVAQAEPNAAWTKARCEVARTQWVVRVPEGSPVAPGAFVWNLSETQATGPAATAIWLGGSDPPTEVCAHAEAAYNQPIGPPRIVTAEPDCLTVGG